MKEINVRELLEAKAANLMDKYPKFVKSFIINFLEKFLRIKNINAFLKSSKNERSFDFIEKLFTELNFSYNLSTNDIKKIPSEGRIIIVSNHPLGGLDGLALLKAIGEVRSDVKIVANDVLMNIENMEDLFLPLDVYSQSKHKKQIKNIEKALQAEQAIILFPAGIVSRLGSTGIKDKKWQAGAIRFSAKFDVPVLPIFIDGRNSILFYLISLINSTLGMLMLPRELFKQKNKKISIRIGDVISSKIFKNNDLKLKTKAKLLQQHCYKIGKGGSGMFNTEKTIIHPISKKILKQELIKSTLLGKTNDGMKIFLCEYFAAPNIMKEIARLREITFRKVGEGTGKVCDLDMYDIHYKHIVLWDDEELEIAGSYRFGITNEIIPNYGIEGLYNSSLFNLTNEFISKYNNSLELGRSFVQQKYWGTNALDYIWQGIGAYLSKNEGIEYLWGAVSISDAYPEFAKALIISYYSKWFMKKDEEVKAHHIFTTSKKITDEVNAILNSDDYKSDYKSLKSALKTMGLSVPVLLRKYTELTEYKGSFFVSWNVDSSFNNAVDGLIILDLSQLKSEFKERYYMQKSFNYPKISTEEVKII